MRPPVLVGVLWVAAALGCAQKHARVDFSERTHGYLAKDYRQVYDRWTRHDSLLRDVDKALEVWVTFKSADFREAYIELYSATYSLPEADRQTLRNAQMTAARTAYEFHVTAQSSEYKWNDLEKASSAWRVTLLDALGHELRPEHIRVVKLPEPYELQFFPSKTPFSKTYSIKFVATGDEFAGAKSGALTLRIASPVGRLELEWKS
jgi:hypothetical protein